MNSDQKKENSKIKVLHVLSRLETGGLENGVVNICNKLDRAYFEPVVCCVKGAGPMVSRLLSDVKVINLNSPEGKVLFRPLHLAKVFRQEKPHIVHNHGWGQCSFDGILGAWIARVPVVLNGEHGAFFCKRYQVILQWLLAYLCKRTLSVSASLKNEIGKHLGIPKSMITVILNGVDTEVFSGVKDISGIKNEVRENYRFDVSEDSFIICCVASLKPQKNQILLLKAIKEINKALPDNRVKVLFVGKGASLAMLTQFVVENLKPGQVAFLGERNDISEILSFADLLVSCSISKYEGLSNVILEAMSSGVPVIATGSVGMTEIIQDGETGFLVGADDVDGLSRKIIYLLQHPDVLRVLAVNARNYIEQYFSIQIMVNRYALLYKELVESYASN